MSALLRISERETGSIGFSSVFYVDECALLNLLSSMGSRLL